MKFMTFGFVAASSFPSIYKVVILSHDFVSIQHGLKYDIIVYM